MSVLSLFLKLQKKLGSRGKGNYLSAVMFHCARVLPNLSLVDYFYEMARWRGGMLVGTAAAWAQTAMVPIKQWGSPFSRSES